MQSVWENPNMKAYQTGIQETVFTIIKEKNRKKRQYLTKQQIVREAKSILGDNPNISIKIGQALNVLQKKTTFRQPRIKKVFCDDSKRNLGWTLADEQTVGLWKENSVR
jgi:hypothetical protein